MADVDHDPDLRRVTLTVETSTGCEDCGDTGMVLGDKLDDEGLWFRQAPCASCSGTGIAHCAADGCSRPAQLVVRLGPARVRHCCGERSHGLELAQRLLEGWL